MNAACARCALVVVAAIAFFAGGVRPVSAFSIGRGETAANCSASDPDCEARARVEMARLERQYHMQQIKLQILDKLGLSKEPKASKPIPKEVLNEALKELKFKSKTPPHVKKYISFSEKANGDVHRMRFRVSGDGSASEDQEVTQVKLFMMVVHKRRAIPKSELKHKKVHISIYQHRIPLGVGSGETSRELVLSTKLGVKRSKWRKLTLPPSVVQDVFDSSSGNSTMQYLDLEIVCSDCDKTVHPILASKLPHGKGNNVELHSSGDSELNLQKRRPFLIIRSRGRARSRPKRDANECSSSSPGCCKKSFYVNFREIGYEWILEPPGYQANYCHGECGTSVPPGLNAHPHTSIIQAAKDRDNNAEATAIKFCCSPKRMSTLSLLYRVDGNLIKRDLDDMIVEECGCA